MDNNMDNRKIVVLDLNDILPNRFQPRIKFSETSITELAESIREHGVIQPIVVRPLGDRYEIIAGERRYKASVLAGKETIPAIVTELNDKDSAEVALIENVQRQNLTPIEEAISYKKILDMGYLTQEELAEKLGKTQSTVANKLRLLNLDDEVQEALLETKISERHARSLLKLTNKEDQRKMLKRIISERLTVRRTDEEIIKMMNENSNRNIEILDFGESTPSPTTNTGVNLNIPATPIIEDAPAAPQSIFNNSIGVSSTPVQENVQTMVNNSGVINSTISTNPQLTPEDLLNPIQNPQTQGNIFGVTNNDSEDDSAESILKPGKFFNMSELESGETNQNTISTTQANIGNPTSTILTSPVTPNELPIQGVANPSVVEPTNPVNNNFITNFGIETATPSEKPTPIIPANPDPLVQTPIAESVNNQAISVPNYSEINAELSNAGLFDQPMNTAPTVPTPNQNNMKQAIDLIRECASKLEALGFKIETEEYDFEDMYQAIFKINK